MFTPEGRTSWETWSRTAGFHALVAGRYGFKMGPRCQGPRQGRQACSGSSGSQTRPRSISEAGDLWPAPLCVTGAPLQQLALVLLHRGRAHQWRVWLRSNCWWGGEREKWYALLNNMPEVQGHVGPRGHEPGVTPTGTFGLPPKKRLSTSLSGVRSMQEASNASWPLGSPAGCWMARVA